MSDYQDYEDWKRWDEDSFGKYTKAEALYFAAELKRAGVHLRSGVRICEAGFGNGAFAGYVRSRGGDYHGSEVNRILIERARKLGFKASETGLTEALGEKPNATVDAVVAFDVLEHMDIVGIQSFLKETLALLKPGGVFLARVPSGDSPFGRVIFHGDITHRTALGSSAIGQLAALAGFEVVDIGPPRLPVIGLGWIKTLRRTCIRLAQRASALFINLVFHEGQPRVITANLVFVLRKPLSN
jgi:SAM-dependent methyltransferase